jgi:pentatricopeptide repeat protein
MTYQEIKTNLCKADRLALAGNVAEADALVRSMLGKGMTPNDLSSNLSPQAMRKLRAFARKGQR